MKNTLFLIFVVFSIISCKTNTSNPPSNKKAFQSAQIDTLFNDKISIRAIVVDNNRVWYAADHSRFGYYDISKKIKSEYLIAKDSMNLEFRSIAKTSDNIYILNVANPAFLYQIDKHSCKSRIVYRENNQKTFYDSMQFWNDKEGIAIGDPVEDCLSLIITRDGGNNWTKLLCKDLPNIVEGEAAFAASNTNIVVKGNSTWIVTGGKKANVFFSPDKGISWSKNETPIVQGGKMTGIFTADFYNQKNGFIAGGNYESLNTNYENKAFTSDSGKTWQLTAEGQGFGFASCVQYVPQSNGRELVTVGASGLYYSSDSGKTWKQLTSDSSLYTIRFLNNHIAIAAGKNKMIKITFK
jgi:photosystem II stability/assembly factor-like uncharacterized protein